MYRVAVISLAACLSAFQPATAQVIAGDNALLEQLVPESFKFEASAVASKADMFNWRTNITYTLANNSGMNLYMGIMMGSVAIGSCAQVNNARGGLQLLPGPNAVAYAVDLSVGTPRPVYVPAGGKVTGMLAAEECSAPNPGSPTAPLTLSLMIGKSESRNSMVQISVSADAPIRQVREQ